MTTIIWIIAIVVVIGLAWYWMSKKKGPSTPKGPGTPPPPETPAM